MLENTDTEFKGDYTATIVKSLVAFSNSFGGKIIIGINDRGKIIGLKDPDDTAKRCYSAITDKVRPDITMNTDIRIEEKDGKALVIIEVNEGDKKPYYIREKGLRAEGVYVREGAVSAPVTEERFQQMIANVRSEAYEKHVSIKQDLTFAYLESKFKEIPMTLTEENMEMLHISERGKYTQLGFILSDQYDQTLKIAVFDNEYKSSFIDRAEFGGSILKQMDDTLSFISRYNRNSSIITGVYRVDIRDYSEISIREALANAFVHRDYAMDDSILISIYPTKLTIVSPGGLRRPYTLEELENGVSSLRNKNLAAVMYRLRIIEAYGTGIPRIFGAYTDLPFKPSITTGGSTFTITLPAERDDGTVTIMNFLKDRAVFTRAELEENLGLNKSEAVAKINMLLENGSIIKMGNGRSVKYRLNRSF